MNRAVPIAMLSWALLVGVAAAVPGPGQLDGLPVEQDALRGLLVALGGIGAAVGGGAALLQRVAPRLLEDERSLLHAGTAGALIWSLGCLVLAGMGMCSTVPLAAWTGALALGWLSRPRLAWSRPSPVVLFALLVVFLPGLIEALAPPTDTDELYYHLGLPQKMLDAGGLVGGVLDPSGNRPLLVHLPMTAMLAIGGESAPRLFHLAITLAVVAATASLGRRHIGPGAGETAALLLVASWSFTRGGGVLGTDMPAALAVLAALDAGLRGHRAGLVIASATALGAKYTAGGAVAGVFLAASLPVRTRVLAGLASLALVSPWWVRNALTGVHPLFPFAGWSNLFPFQYLEKYGAGRSLTAFLLLPWNVFMSAETDSFRFLGRLNPALLALAPPALWAGIRRGPARQLLLASAALLLFWASGPHLLRFLLPGLPVLALAAGSGAARLLETGRPGRAALGAVALAGLMAVPANLGPVVTHAGTRVEAARGRETPDAFYARTLRQWPALRWANAHLPPDAVVAVLYSWHGYLLERPTRLGSVEDHIPVRHWQLTHGASSLSRLQREGVTHVLIGRQRFIRNAYPFVPEPDLQSLFRDPTEAWNEQLLMEATLLFEDGSARVYALDDDPNGSRP